MIGENNMCTNITNTDEFMVGDIVISLPNRKNIHRNGYEYAVRRFEVVEIDYENNTVTLFDLDNSKIFIWGFHIPIDKEIHTLLVLENEIPI